MCSKLGRRVTECDKALFGNRTVGVILAREPEEHTEVNLNLQRICTIHVLRRQYMLKLVRNMRTISPDPHIGLQSLDFLKVGRYVNLQGLSM